MLPREQNIRQGAFAMSASPNLGSKHCQASSAVVVLVVALVVVPISGTLPETNSLPLKMVVSNRNILFQASIFRCYVSFREGTSAGTWADDACVAARGAGSGSKPLILGQGEGGQIAGC